jgi:hypothetical protein
VIDILMGNKIGSIGICKSHWTMNEELILTLAMMSSFPIGQPSHSLGRYLQPLDDSANFEHLNVERTDETLTLKNKAKNDQAFHTQTN